MVKTPYIIGLTGNIASGKSGIRQYLENCGALTIDADLLAQRTYMKNAPAYESILHQFGKGVLDVNAEIDRKKLGGIVFSDDKAMRELEEIVHPHTLEALENLLLQTKTDFVVLEMIKLFEIGLAPLCDVIWVSYADDQIRLERLVNERRLSEGEARARINSQSPQQTKLDKADFIINTEGSYTQTWQQIEEALTTYSIPQQSVREIKHVGHGLIGKPLSFQDVLQAADLLSIEAQKSIQVEEIFRFLSKKSLLAIHHRSEIIGLVTWKMSNFVSYINHFFIDPEKQTHPKGKALLSAFQEISDLHLCEVLSVSSSAGIGMDNLKNYQYLIPNKIINPIWRAEIIKATTTDTPVYYKPLKMEGKIVKVFEDE